MDEMCGEFDTMSLVDYKPGEHYWVHVTHINSPCNFYVRPANYKYRMGLLEQRGEKMRCNDVVYGALVIYKSVLLNMYIRGRVLLIHANYTRVLNCDVLAVDYGFHEFNMDKEEMYAIHKDDQFPPVVTNCQLANCRPIEGINFDTEAVLAFKMYVGNERVRMFVRSLSGNQPVVELVNTCPQEIGMLLALTNYTQMGYTEPEIESKPEPEEVHNDKIKHPMLVVGEELHVRTQSGSKLGAFYAAKHPSFREFLPHRQEFTNYCESQNDLSAEDAVLGQLVGVKEQHKVKYERALIIQINPNNVIVVQLIDWGKIIKVKFHELRLIKNEFYFELPALAIYCTLEAAQMSDEKLKKCLLLGYEYYIKIISLGDSFKTPHTVSITRIHQKYM